MLVTAGEPKGCMVSANSQKAALCKHLPLGATVSGRGGDAGVEIGVYSFLARIMPARSEKLS